MSPGELTVRIALIFFGFEVVNTVLYSYSISFSFLVIAILSPLLSGIADASGKKLFFMKLFAYLGSISCIGLFFFLMAIIWNLE